MVMLLRFFVCGLLSALLLPSANATELKVCLENDDFPPFSFHAVGDKGIIGDSGGSSIELLQDLANKLQVTIQLSRLPWTRCMQAVENGQMDMALDAYYDTERAQRFDFSTPYYYLTPQLFYLRSRFPDGPPAQTVSEMKKFKGCGIHGYSYAHYGLSVGDLDQKAQTHEQLVQKLRAGRCDYFLEEREIIQGFVLTGQDYLADQAIHMSEVADAQHPQLHLILSRRSKLAQSFKPAIDAEVSKQVESGKIHRSVLRQLKFKTAP